jgi:hypothetical protein
MQHSRTTEMTFGIVRMRLVSSGVAWTSASTSGEVVRSSAGTGPILGSAGCEVGLRW